MKGWRSLLLPLLLATPLLIEAQRSPEAPPPSDDRLRAAEEALEKNDLKAAVTLLTELARDRPHDAHVLFDLGYAEDGLDEEAAAKHAYAAAIEAYPAMGEAHVALGLLLARTRSGSRDEVTSQLRAGAASASAAAEVRARAFRTLAQMEGTAEPTKASDDLLQAVRLTHETEPDIVLSADLALAAGELAGAEKAYRRALEQQPDDLNAAAGLGQTLRHEDKLVEADEVLTGALTKHPDDAGLLASLAVVKMSENKPAEALNLLEPLVTPGSAAKDPALARELARLYVVTDQKPKAEALYGELVTVLPNDPALLDDYADVLVRDAKFPQAEAMLQRAVSNRGAWTRSADWAEAEGHLAFAASRNHEPQVALQALAARATVLPNSAATLFLQATSYDSLHQTKSAIEAYRAFLAAANGKFPDEEFEARHRLVALEHMK